MSRYFKQQKDQQQPQQSQIEVLRSELKDKLGRAAENQNSKRHRYIQKISALKQKQESCIGGRHPEHYQMFQSKIKELEEKLQNVDEKGRSAIDFQITYDGLLQQFSQIEGLDPVNLEGKVRNDNFTILCSIKRQAFNLQRQFQQRKFLSLLNVLIDATTLLIEKYKKAGVVVQFDMDKEEIQQILNSVEQHREMRQRQKEERRKERKKLERGDNFEEKQGKQFEEDQFVKQKNSKYEKKQQFQQEEQQPFYQNFYQNQEQPQQQQNRKYQKQERQDRQDRQEKQYKQDRPENKERNRQEKQDRQDRDDRQDRRDRKDKQDRYVRQDRQDRQDGGRQQKYEVKNDQNLKQEFAQQQQQQIPKQEPYQEKQQQQQLEKKHSELQIVIDQLNQKLQIKEEQNKKLSEQQQIEKKKQEQQEENLCQICFNNKKEYVAVPCGHFVYCGDCKHLVKKECLICRSPCTQLLRIFT